MFRLFVKALDTNLIFFKKTFSRLKGFYFKEINPFAEPFFALYIKGLVNFVHYSIQRRAGYCVFLFTIVYGCVGPMSLGQIDVTHLSAFLYLVIVTSATITLALLLKIPSVKEFAYKKIGEKYIVERVGNPGMEPLVSVFKGFATVLGVEAAAKGVHGAYCWGINSQLNSELKTSLEVSRNTYKDHVDEACANITDTSQRLKTLNKYCEEWQQQDKKSFETYNKGKEQNHKSMRDYKGICHESINLGRRYLLGKDIENTTGAAKKAAKWWWGGGGDQGEGGSASVSFAPPTAPTVKEQSLLDSFATSFDVWTNNYVDQTNQKWDNLFASRREK